MEAGNTFVLLFRLGLNVHTLTVSLTTFFSGLRAAQINRLLVNLNQNEQSLTIQKIILKETIQQGFEPNDALRLTKAARSSQTSI